MHVCRPRPFHVERLRGATIALLLAASTLASCSGGGGGGSGGVASTAAILRWNQIAIDASGLDHAPANVGPPHVFGQQVGPCRAARAMAIVHIAMFEAVNAVYGGHQSYVGLPQAPIGTSVAAAVAQAAHDTLSALFPSQAAIFALELAAELEAIPGGAEKSNGIAFGQEAAALILQARANDGSQHAEPLYGTGFIASDQPGFWRQDPIGQQAVALGAQWGLVTPFMIESAAQFRCPQPPALTSTEYATAFDEVKMFGGDVTTTPTVRTAEQTQIGIFWAYDGTPSLCAPPRLYNQIAVRIAAQQGSDLIETARLLAVFNVAMADAGLASWESKFFYQYWRPITGIREADAGTGPTGLGDGNPVTAGDATYVPLCAPASNVGGPNFTPPFPSYPSGHATFGGAIFQTLRRFYGRDDIAFTFVSDEFNGVTTDNLGVVRPLVERSFSSFSQAEEENGQSRIYLGIHWSFDKTEGIAQGRSVANYIFDRLYPVTGP
jgi:hypothetical protein